MNDEASGFSGFVTRFKVQASFLSGFEPHTVGANRHVEYWIPSKQLPSFKRSIDGLVEVGGAYFGPRFVGWVPDKFGFKGKTAVEQFVGFAKTWDYSRMDFVCEASVNQKAVYLNFTFWAQHDFSSFGIDSKRRNETLSRLRTVWQRNRVEVPLPEVEGH